MILCSSFDSKMASLDDDCFDFNAPKHYFDFNSALDEPDDSYFGKYGSFLCLFISFFQ